MHSLTPDRTCHRQASSEPNGVIRLSMAVCALKFGAVHAAYAVVGFGSVPGVQL